MSAFATTQDLAKTGQVKEGSEAAMTLRLVVTTSLPLLPWRDRARPAFERQDAEGAFQGLMRANPRPMA